MAASVLGSNDRYLQRYHDDVTTGKLERSRPQIFHSRPARPLYPIQKGNADAAFAEKKGGHCSPGQPSASPPQKLELPCTEIRPDDMTVESAPLVAASRASGSRRVRTTEKGHTKPFPPQRSSRRVMLKVYIPTSVPSSCDCSTSRNSNRVLTLSIT